MRQIYRKFTVNRIDARIIFIIGVIKIIVGTYYNESNCIDIEYGHTKVVADRHPLIFPSLVGPAKAINFSLGKKNSPGDVVARKGYV